MVSFPVPDLFTAYMVMLAGIVVVVRLITRPAWLHRVLTWVEKKQSGKD